MLLRYPTVAGLRVIGDESFHPNYLGQQLMSKAILSATSNMTLGMPTTNTNNTPQDPQATSITDPTLAALLNVPSNGLAQSYPTPLPKQDLTPILYKSSNWSSSVNSTPSTPLAPNTSYNVTINSTPTSLGTFTSDASGNLAISVTVPSTLAPGIHTIHITGRNFGGDSVDLFETVFVAASDTDYNGDGISNNQDPCPSTTASGVDINLDGIDDACEGYVGTAPLYRARNGITANGEDSSLIYIDRNTSVANSLGITDTDTNGDGWVTVAHTQASDDASSAVANFSITDTGVNPTYSYARYVPYLSTRTVDNGCVELTPSSLVPMSDSSPAVAMSQVLLNSSTCRAQGPGVDVNTNGVPDNQEQLYRARNGIAANGEDPAAIYIERNTTAAEAILGLSDYDPNADGWSLIGVTSGSDNGVVDHLVLLDGSGSTISENGTIPDTKLHALSTADLRNIKPVVIDKGSSCQAVQPASVNVVTNASLFQTNTATLPINESCAP